MKKPILIGATGKLGLEIKKLYNRPLFLLSKKNSSDFLKMISNSNLLIDVSHPNVSVEKLKLLLKNKKTIPYIVGCTGWSNEQKKTLFEYSKKAPVLFCPNFSILINILNQFLLANQNVFKKLGYSALITETHHIHKKDKPSGTAKLFFDSLSSLDTKVKSIRRGEVVGDHEICLSGKFDSLILTHSAHDRKLFAQGALLAIQWMLKTKHKPMVFTMNDVLNLK